MAKICVMPDDTTFFFLFEEYNNYSHRFREASAVALAVPWEAGHLAGMPFS